MKIGFYVLGKKGYSSLVRFIDDFGIDHIAFVMSARDSGIENDWFSDIAELCSKSGFEFRSKWDESNKPLPAADFSFAIGWRWMINEESRLIIFHDSLLPKYRGFSPLVNMLVDGRDEIGVTALFASEEYDKGEIIYQEKKRISYPIKISDAIDDVIPLYSKLVINITREIFARGVLNSIPQNEHEATFSAWRDERDYFIDWGADAKDIRRFVDALGKPYRGAASFLNNEVVRILDVEPVQDVVVENRRTCLGKTIFVDDNYPVVVCGRGLLKITDLRSESGESLIGRIQFRSRFENFK